MAKFLRVYIRVALFSATFLVFASTPVALFIGAMATDSGTREAKLIGGMVMLAPVVLGGCLFVSTFYILNRPRWHVPAAIVITGLLAGILAYFGPNLVLEAIAGIFKMFCWGNC